MTWVPPVFECGECGGRIARWPMKNLLKQEILDWRHITVPGGVEAHRAVLGTPGPPVRLLSAKVEEEPEPEESQIPAPITPARPALHDDLPPAAVRLDRKAELNGWRVEAWYMHGPLVDARGKFSRMVESVVLRLERDGHLLVASWRTKRRAADDEAPAWEFDLAYSLAHEAKPLSSTELSHIVETPRILCEDCGEPPALHIADGGFICHAVWKAAQTHPKE